MKSRKSLLTLLFLIFLFQFTGLQLFAQTSSQKKAIERLTKFSDSFETLVEFVNPAVVQIFATGYGPTGSSSAGIISKQRSSGSGVIIDSQGYIITNAHVIEGSRIIKVQLAEHLIGDIPGKSILKPRGRLIHAKIVGLDLETDLALLKIEGEKFPFLKLGDSDLLKQGQLVFAFGSPLGLVNSVTMGVISSVARQLSPENPMIYIQTDAPINPGNSGGPLVTTDGFIVGINTLIFSQSGGSEGIGFAAPSNIVRHVYNQMKLYNRVRRGEIGVNAQTINPVMSVALKLPRDWGVILGDVTPGGPADKVGLKPGDLVLAIDGKPMENARQFDVNLYRRAIGYQVRLDVLRGSELLSKKVTVVERPDDPFRFIEMVSPEKNLIPELGILCMEIDENIAKLLPPLRKRAGVLVAARGNNAIYFDGGFRAGDIIYDINQTQISNLDDLRAKISSINIGDAVVMQVERRGQLMYIVFEME